MAVDKKPDTTLLLYVIESPNWAQVQETHHQRIAQLILEGGWRTVGGRRRGFLNCQEQGSVIYGYFAREGALKVEQYDNNQRPLDQRQDSFVRMLFVLFLQEGLLLAQSIRVYNYKDLTGPKVRRALFNELEITFKSSGLSFQRISLNRYRQEYSKEQMLQIFFDNDIERVEVDQLYGMRVPATVHLFNPDFDADEFTKAVIDEALENSKQVSWTGESLQTIKIVKGLMTAGYPKVIEGKDEFGEPREWSRSAPDEIILPLDTETTYFPEEDLEHLLAFVRRKFGLLRERLIDIQRAKETGISDLPLFSEDQ
jgi:hypothetical protein